MSRRNHIIYSEAFKLQVVNEVESGKFNSCCEAAARYGIKGTVTVYNWARKYGRNHLIGKVVKVEKVGERDQFKMSQQRNRELEALVSKLSLELVIERSYLELACEEANIDVESFKKKERGNVLIK